MLLKFRSAGVGLFLAIGALVSAPAHADVITTFDLNGVNFDDGTSATGSFQFDSTNDTLLNISIATSAGSGFLALDFTGSVTSTVDLAQGSILGTVDIFSIVDTAGNGDIYDLSLVVADPTSLTSPNPLLFTGIHGGAGSNEQDLTTTSVRFLPSGSLDPVRVPEPPSALLLLGALILLGVVGKRRSA